MSSGTKKRKHSHARQQGERERLFKYVSFSDQIARISMDYATVSTSIPNQIYDKKTFFYEAVSKWIELDYGDDFKSFLADINHQELATYAQLLHHQQDIADSLKEHLTRDGNAARVALLEILIGFASDLREDFLEYLWDFFDVIMSLIEKSKQDIELLEACFRCLAVFFKLQWRNLVKNLRKTLVRLTPLFTSHSHYIRRFIAESSSFLLRRAGNMEKITVFLVERSLELNEKNNTDGTIQLFFNTIKGLLGQFQTGAPQMLNDILGSIFSIENDEVREHGMEILKEVMSECVEHGAAKNCLPITDVLLNRFDTAVRQSIGFKNLDDICRLIRVWLEESEGRKFTSHLRLIELCTLAIENKKYTATEEFLDICALNTKAYAEKNTSMTPVRDLIEKTIEKFGNKENIKLILGFYSKLMDLNIFDIWCMETIGKLMDSIFSDSKALDNETIDPVLRFYFDHTIDRHPFFESLDDRNLTINVAYHKTFRSVLQKILREPTQFDDSFYPMALFVLPWLHRSNETMEDGELLMERLKATITKNEMNDKDYLNTWLLANYLQMMSSGKLTDLKAEKLFEFLSKNHTNELALRVFLQLIDKTEDFDSIDGVEFFGRLLSVLGFALAHPISTMRKLAILILKTFDRFLTFESTNQGLNVFDVMLKVEESPIRFETHRERAAYLRRLKHGSLIRLLPSQYRNELQLVVLRFTVAQYFENLTAYWPQIAEVAASFSSEFSADDIWNIFEEFVNNSTRCIRDLASSRQFVTEISSESLNNIFVSIRGEVNQNINFWVFRLELLKLMEAEFVELAERKNRHLISLLFDVYDHEFQRVTARTRKQDDLTVGFDGEKIEVVRNDEEETEGVEKDDETTQTVEEVETHQLDRKLVFNTIKTLISILSKFGNLKTAYRSAELLVLLNELIRSDDNHVQKAALNCLFAFKNKALELYRQNFDKLADDKTFRDELIHFSVDNENTVIAVEHRSTVMPVLMRLLDGKMHAHVTRKGTSKRPAIFRFVAGCLPEELEMFLKTVFWNTTSIQKTCDNIVNTYDPHKTIALRRITSTLECLDEVFRKLVRSMSVEQNNYVYQITIACHLLIRLGLEHSDVTAHHRKILRHLRKQAFELSTTMFNAFQHRQFTSDELEILFDQIIEPHLLDPYKSAADNLTTFDCPWAITRFFCSLTKMPFFYPLLNVPFSSELNSRTPLSLLCITLFSSTTTRSLQSLIVESFLNLFTYADEKEAVSLPTLRQEPLRLEDNGERPFGTRVAVNHVESLLKHLQLTIPNEIRSSNRSVTLDLSLLDVLSEFSSESVLGSEFASTLLTFVERGLLRNEDHLAAIINSVSHFLTYDKQPNDYFTRVIPLLSTLRSRRTRTSLVQLLGQLRKNSNFRSDLNAHVERLEELESWDKQRINEPDYEKRHEVLAELLRLYDKLHANEMPLEALRAYIHSHFYSLAHVDEISIRSASSNCICLLVTFIKQSKKLNEEKKQEIVRNDFIPLVSRTLRSSNESVRHEAVNVLATLVDNFGAVNSLLEPLKQIRSVDDQEVCFFENVVHLQLHRRQRAFNRLYLGLQSSEINIPLEVFEKFIMPLIRPYLLRNEDKYTALSDEAVRLFAEITRHEPWPVYHRTLTYYINGVRKEETRVRPIIRVLVAILDAFHFDLASLTLPHSAFDVRRHRQPRKKLGAALLKESKPKIPEEEMEIDENLEPLETFEQPPNLQSLEEKEDGNLSDEQRILATILRVVIPRLRECIQPSQEFHAHKKAQKGDKYFADEEEINRTPIALATVKLLKKLPTWVMDLHLQGVLLTIMQLLLSRSFIVRQSARKCMEEIMHALGPVHLPKIIRELRQKFTRGYQVHVMIYTVHSLIASLQNVLEPGDLDACLTDVFEVVKQQQFGVAEEERQINIIKSRTPEAKAAKSQETFLLLGRFISEECLNKFIDPMKHIMEDTPNAATQKKLQELLRSLSAGLRRNTGIAPPVLLNFSKTILCEYVGEMCQQYDALRAQQQQEQEERNSGYRPSNCYLLAPEPKRLGVIVKTSTKSKVAIFVEFGAQLLGDVLSEKHFDSESIADVQLLDPFLGIILDALRLKYEKITALALRALSMLLKFPLPSLATKMSTLVDQLFILLGEYASASGTTRLNVIELNQHLFKCMVLVVRQSTTQTFSRLRLQILLNYVESDVLDSHKQATAFNLAKALIVKQIRDEKIDELIRYLAELSITSPSDQIRTQCRSTMQTYFRSHPDGPANAKKWLHFFLDQLDYEFSHGRISALESIHSMFSIFNESITDKLGIATFLRLVERFREDNDEEVLKYVSAAVRELIASVSDGVRRDVFTTIEEWLGSKKLGLRFTGARALTELAKTQEFKLNVEQTKSIIIRLKRCFTRAVTSKSSKAVEASMMLMVELIRNHLDLFRRVLKKSPKMQKLIIGGLPALLTSEESKVRFSAAVLLEHLLASTESIWPLLAAHANFDDLCMASLQQLRQDKVLDPFSEEAVKNLVTLSVQLDEQTFDELCEKLAAFGRTELRRDAGITRRVNLFKFMAAQLAHFERETAQFESLVRHLSFSLFRELTGKSARHGEQLLQIATELAAILREKIGVTEFNDLLAAHQIESSRRTTNRKRERKELALAEPERAARVRQKANLRKASGKKRKLDELRPYRIQKRRRVEEARERYDFD
ncbi:Small subunit processome component 20-like protein [Aphelenchoides besseyi]|nr:Small subunit processome component 20-like protein [Aphelenchoides besseyi]